jgi:hypothetical protein
VWTEVIRLLEEPTLIQQELDRRLTAARSFCRTVRVDCSTLSPDSGTCGSPPPEVSSTAFNASPPDLQPMPLMDMDFAVACQLVRHRMPHIWFLFIGSRLCSTLPSDPASRRSPCASLSLLLHQDVKGTYTPKLLNNARRTRTMAPGKPGPLRSNVASPRSSRLRVDGYGLGGYHCRATL